MKVNTLVIFTSLFLGSCGSLDKEYCRDRAWELTQVQAEQDKVELDPATFRRRGVYSRFWWVMEYWVTKSANHHVEVYESTRRSFGRCE